MKNKQYIRKIFAVLLLLIFIFSTTPKRYLHSVFADHTDAFYNTSNSNLEKSFKSHSFNCEIDQLVVELPFSTSIEFIYNFPLSHIDILKISINHLYEEDNVGTQFLRGPPTSC